MTATDCPPLGSSSCQLCCGRPSDINLMSHSYHSSLDARPKSYCNCILYHAFISVRTISLRSNSGYTLDYSNSGITSRDVDHQKVPYPVPETDLERIRVKLIAWSRYQLDCSRRI